MSIETNHTTDTLTPSTGTLNIAGTVQQSGTALQTALVSGTSIKTVNSTSLLGSGDVAVQATLVNTTNIKSVNGTTLLGSGNLAVGDVVGPGSATDNAITRFDATTGKLVQNSAATVSDDGIIRSATNSAANAVSVPLVNWLMLTADYGLANSGSAQKAFNTTTNGTLTLPTGVYYFDTWIYLTTMSATSGNAAFSMAGTAVMDRWGQTAIGIDNSTPLAAGTQTGSASVTAASPASAVTAGTGTGAIIRASGMFRISTGGTIIPSLTLVTAVAGVLVKAGSWFRIQKIGESSETSVGAWT